ncbi:interleukin-15 receptor subunit alpha isoform X2 [Lampris incognitus]|uniref:interleukin-15 receptor subunit alpha isoform X2 n=1 Tax=Lampris incognitus TaxID=2546036 RepID=UPI0024B557B3|nr:interleukin-15 receptor subunit alpha isoform X2 [Lampris incognitus]
MSLICRCLVFLLFSLDGTADGSAKGHCRCPCARPPPWNWTLPPDAVHCCGYESKYRYTCMEGYVRQAGTSNLTKCKDSKGGPQWSTPNLVCIPDPKNRPSQQTSTTVQGEISSGTSTKSPTSGKTTEAGPPEAGPPGAGPPEAEPPGAGPPGVTPPAASVTFASTLAGAISSDNTTSQADLWSSHPVVSGLSVTGALVIGCALTGLGFFWRRRSRSAVPQPRGEEQLPMNLVGNAPL